MNKKLIPAITHLAVLAFVTFSAAGIFGQIASTVTSRLPFDHTDKSYAANGVIASLIDGRRNGADGASVFDTAPSKQHRGVRIIATHPAYGANGEILFWNKFGELGKDAFTADKPGERAATAARRMPVYVFPSQTTAGKERQAALIPVSDSYFASNPLGLGMPVYVIYTDDIMSDEASAYVADLASRNGLSLDGTPIIKTIVELSEMTRLGVIKQLTAEEIGIQRRPYIMAKVMAEPENGAIAPDAFLTYVAEPDGSPLQSEEIFLNTFECLRNAGGDVCWSN